MPNEKQPREESFIFTFSEALAVGEKKRLQITHPSGNRKFVILYAVFNADAGDVAIQFFGIKHIIQNQINLYASSLSPNEIRFTPNLVGFSDGSSGIILINLSATAENVDGLLVGFLEPIE